MCDTISLHLIIMIVCTTLLQYKNSGPGDTLAVQTRMTHNYGESKKHDDEPPFYLPIVYEDDHFAVVNKPVRILLVTAN